MAAATDPATPSGGTAVIIGAGPAGLTAAFELQERTGMRPIVLEASQHMGGISRTEQYRGNRIDIGGHRFFSKSDRVMDWWLARLPLQQLSTVGPSPDERGRARPTITYQNRSRIVDTATGPDPEQTDAVMLLRDRRSRIFTMGRFFPYPVRLDPQTLRQLGLVRSLRIAMSYFHASLRPRPEHSLEDFLINRFGAELYRIFFESYTQKVWGLPCSQISPDWGAQRIKGLSLRGALRNALTHSAAGVVDGRVVDLSQKQSETSLIERFLYPKLGPGQMWQTVAEQITARGGEIRTGWRVVGLRLGDGQARQVLVEDPAGRPRALDADVVFSTMPLQDLIAGISPQSQVPAEVGEVAAGLVYRDFITVGLLLDDLAHHEPDGSRLRDTWIYVQDPDVKVGRVQIFNNWSPYMVADRNTTWVGMEYFCDVGDALWSLTDSALQELAATELCRLGLARPPDVRDGVVIRMPRAYPAYFGSYGRFDRLRRFVDGIDNLWLIGRNGMHRYNNQDHSMLTAMTAVDQIAAGRTDKAPVWAVNTEDDYHEDHKPAADGRR